MKLGEAMYEASSRAASGADAGAKADAAADGDDDVVDADFEEVKDDDRRSRPDRRKREHRRAVSRLGTAATDGVSLADCGSARLY